MAYTFTADSEKQIELANKLNNYADQFDSDVADTFTVIDGMGTSWVGEDYEQFNTNTHAYEKALSDLSATFRAFGTHYMSMAEGTTLLSNVCVSIVNNLTDINSADFSGATPAADSSSTSDGISTTETGGSVTGTDGTGTTAGETVYSGDGSTDENINDTSNQSVNGDEIFDTVTGGNDYSKTVTPVTLSRGNIVSVGNGSYSYYGTTGSGVNLYTDSQGNILYESNGSMVNAQTQVFGSLGVEVGTTNATTSNVGVTTTFKRGVDSWNKTTDIIVGEDRCGVNNVETSRTYDDSDDAPEVLAVLN